MHTKPKEQRRRMINAWGFNFYDIFIYLFTGIFALLCLYPLWYVFIGSISPLESFAAAPTTLLPVGGITFAYYESIFVSESFQRAFFISISKTLLSTVGMLAFTSMLAYGVSKSDVKGMKLLNTFVVITFFFGGTIIQTFLLFKDMGIFDTFGVLVLPFLVDTWTFIMMRNYFLYNVPPALEDAAAVDGANEVVTFFRIILPVSKAVIAAMFLFFAVRQWNDWTSYTYYVRKTSLRPFVYLLRELLIAPEFVLQTALQGQSWDYLPSTSLRYTTIMCAMLPIMMLYPFLQKHFTKGILLGAVKG